MMSKKISVTSTCSQESFGCHGSCDSGFGDTSLGDVQEFIPPLSSTLNNDVPDSVLLLSLFDNHKPQEVPSAHPNAADFCQRVRFTEEEVLVECDTIKTIHTLICHNKVGLSKLYDLVNSKSSESESAPFISNIGFEEYIRTRSFLFEIGASVCNRGFGYRDGMRKIAHFVDKKGQSEGCSIKDLIDNLVTTLPVYKTDDVSAPWDDSWFSEKELTAEDVLCLLSVVHKDLFHVQGIECGDISQMSVRLTHKAYKIASLWHDVCNPPIPDGLLWDESRVYSFNASVTYVHEHHGLAAVTSGTFRGRLVYIHRSRIGPTDLRRTLHIGAVVAVTAHITLNTTSQFRALRLTIINNFANLEIKKVGRDRPVEREHLEFRVPPPIHHRSDLINNGVVSHYMQLLRRAADSEKQMIAFADNLIAGNMYSFDGLQRRLIKYKYNHRNSPFATVHELDYFLCQRPHLYNCNAMGASCASEQEREVAIAFIEMISSFGFAGAPKKELRNKLVCSSYPLNGIVADGLDEYIMKISPVLDTVRLANPVEEMVMLRGTYIGEEKLFVHHFKPSFLPID